MKLKKVREDIIVMALLLAVCIYFLVHGIDAQIPESPAARGQMFTPRTFPRLCISVIAVCCFAGFIKNIRQYILIKRQNDAGETVRRWKELSGKERIGQMMPLICFALCVVYALIFSKFGFVAATVIVPPILLFIMGCRKWQHYLCVYGFCAVMYAIFVFVLNVNLP